jgi:hypothetical protein
MRLDQFLTEHEISTDYFAAEVGAAHRVTVHRWMTGQRMPNRDFMSRITFATGGSVQPEDFYGHLIDE